MGKKMEEGKTEKNAKRQVFNYSDLFLDENFPEATYYRRKNEEKKSVAWGQRKLLLGEIAFLTIFWDPSNVPNPILVCAGGAPGTHYNVLEKLFPEISEIHLYDPRPFRIAPSPKIKCHQEYFTNKTAQYWADRNDVLFVSDIRTADYTKMESLDKNEEQIVKDMRFQETWYNIMKPVKAMLKFRLPYTTSNLPLELKYLSGYILKQVWAPQTSTETRLIPHGHNKTKIWNSKSYEDKMFYLNAIMREKVNYLNIFDNSEKPLDNKELTNDYDSTAEAMILKSYYIKKNLRDKFEDYVINLSRFITQKLNAGKKFKYTLQYLRENPRAIKERYIKPRKTIHILKSDGKNKTITVIKNKK